MYRATKRYAPADGSYMLELMQPPREWDRRTDGQIAALLYACFRRAGAR